MPQKIAHRGFRNTYPENTLYAFSKAMHVADGIELDVHLSKDGVPVVIHDESLDRTTTGHGYVKDYLYSELISFNACKGLGRLFEPIPTLDDYLKLVKTAHIISNIELKTNIFEYNGIEDKVYDLIHKYRVEENCIVSSFNHKSIYKFKTLYKDIKCGILTSCILVNAVEYVQQLKCEYYHPEIYIPVFEVHELHKHNIGVNVWHSIITDGMQDKFKRAIVDLSNAGVDGIITDCVDVFA